ncbi:hypothetical protein BOTBODRAFT_504647 [Botryobasidium botryosum FD-172 SS1]|uniref:Aldehyde dehydrogenase domain-containing protein n=1 Tax=Botryobasidium botryosum (strain FD-172 SS1) TaxID=930990 RepID=A0A067MDS4_BOTB1|nr:hypothetical protein BOTBODRAFT_504647 [Botryobasidium botryosum FD-172 SS1]
MYLFSSCSSLVSLSIALLYDTDPHASRFSLVRSVVLVRRTSAKHLCCRLCKPCALRMQSSRKGKKDMNGTCHMALDGIYSFVQKPVFAVRRLPAAAGSGAGALMRYSLSGAGTLVGVASAASAHPSLHSPMTSNLAYTPIEEIPKIRDALRQGFKTGKTRSIAYRKEQLLHLGYMFQDNAERFIQTLASDLGRPAQESIFLEINTMAGFILRAYNEVDAWAKPEGVKFDFNFFVTRPKILKEPKGTVLLVGPFNFPIFSTFKPLIGIIAAGCAAVIKPSELTPATSILLAELLPKYLDPELYRIVNGGVEESTKLLELQWDHIMYTGSGTIGRIYAAAAAKRLTPITLELGGKCPVIIDPKTNLALAAKRLLWGRIANAGQTCVAPDYILCPASVQDELVAGFQAAYNTFFPTPEDARTSMSRIVAPHHHDRLKGLLDNTAGAIVVGGETDKADLWVAPTVVRDVKDDDVLMQQEIFGPILPVVPVEDLDSAIEFVASRDNPLTVYVFSDDPKFKTKVIENTLSGGVVMNDTLMQAAMIYVCVKVDDFPIGGVGASGYGSYGGKAGFDTFTHRRPFMDVPGWLDFILKSRYAPYTPEKLKTIQSLAGKKIPYPRPGTNGGSSGWGKWLGLG